MRALLVALVLLAGCSADAPDGDPQEAPTEPLAGDVVFGDADAPIRPGASLGGFCTLNFVFTGSGPGIAAPAAFIGTAGHCTSLGDRATYGDQAEFGTVVFDSDEAEVDPAVDFSLILLDAPGAAHPGMLGFVGPTGVADVAGLAAGDRVGLHGYGMVLGDADATRAREGVLVSWDEERYRADMPAVWGDSGAPVLHVQTGTALGIVSQFNTGEVPPTTDIGPTLPFILQETAKAGFMLELATV